MRHRLLLCVALAWASTVSSQALAVSPELARERGAGHTSRGDLNSLTAILTAPATLHLRSRYDAGADFSIGPDKLRRFHVAAVDSQTGPLAAGVVFGRETSRPTVRTEDLPGWKPPGEAFDDLRDARMRAGGGLGFSVLNRTLGFGASVEWNQRTNGFEDTTSALSGGASMAAHLGESVVLSVNGERLIPTGLFFAPTLVTGGFRWSAGEMAALAADVVTDFTSQADPTVGFGVGADFRVAPIVPLRVGFFRDAASQSDSLTAGIGVGNEQGSLDYAFEQPLGGAGITSAEHTIALVLSF